MAAGLLAAFSFGAPAAGVASAAGDCQDLSDGMAGRRWVGEPTPALAATADELQGEANDFPGSLSGVAFCSDYSGVEVFVKEAGPALDKVNDIRARAAGAATVHVRSVTHSLEDLLAEARRLRGDPDFASAVDGWGPDILHDGLLVRLSSRAGDPSEVLAQRGPDVDAVRAIVGDSMRVRFRPAGTGENAGTRPPDGPPSVRGWSPQLR